MGSLGNWRKIFGEPAKRSLLLPTTDRGHASKLLKGWIIPCQVKFKEMLGDVVKAAELAVDKRSGETNPYRILLDAVRREQPSGDLLQLIKLS